MTMPGADQTGCPRCASHILPMTRAKAEAAAERSQGLCVAMPCPNGLGYHLVVVPDSGGQSSQAAGP